MNSNITVETALVAKTRLERMISDALVAFTVETGLTVDDVDVSRIDMTINDGKTNYVHRVNVKVRL